jgi:hypothetical protein
VTVDSCIERPQNQRCARQRVLEITCHLLRRVFPQTYTGTRLSVVLESYGDESATDDLSPYSAFAGYIGDEASWKAFSVAWLDALRDLKLRELSPDFETEFHTSQFYRLAKEKGWPTERIDACVIELGKIIKKHTEVGFAAMVATANYEKAFSPQIRRRRLKNRYYLIFEGAIRMEWRYIYHGAPAGLHRVAFFFDEKRGFETHAKRLFDGWTAQWDTKGLMASRTFLKSKDFPPIQAADFLAYELRRYGQNGMHESADVTTAMNALKRDLLVHEFEPDELKAVSERLENQMRAKLAKP